MHSYSETSKNVSIFLQPAQRGKTHKGKKKGHSKSVKRDVHSSNEQLEESVDPERQDGDEAGHLHLDVLPDLDISANQEKKKRKHRKKQKLDHQEASDIKLGDSQRKKPLLRDADSEAPALPDNEGDRSVKVNRKHNLMDESSDVSELAGGERKKPKLRIASIGLVPDSHHRYDSADTYNKKSKKELKISHLDSDTDESKSSDKKDPAVDSRMVGLAPVPFKKLDHKDKLEASNKDHDEIVTGSKESHIVGLAPVPFKKLDHKDKLEGSQKDHEETVTESKESHIVGLAPVPFKKPEEEPRAADESGKKSADDHPHNPPVAVAFVPHRQRLPDSHSDKKVV